MMAEATFLLPRGKLNTAMLRTLRILKSRGAFSAKDCLDQLRKTNPDLVEREGADFVLATFKEGLECKFGKLDAKLAPKGE